MHLAHTDYSCLVNEPVHSNPILPSESTVTGSGTSQTMHFAHKVYCYPGLSQFIPTPFCRLKVQYQVLEQPKPVHLAHTDYSCFVNEPVHSNPILPSDRTVTGRGTSQTSASCPNNLLFPCPEPVQSNPILPSVNTILGSGKSQTSASCPHRLQLTCQWASSVQFHFTVWENSKRFWNNPNQCILPKQFTVSRSWASSVQSHFTVWQYNTRIWKIPNQRILPTQITVALSMTQFNPIPFYRLSVK